MTFQGHQPPPAPVYHSYLVRLWQEGPSASWRASVQCVRTGTTVCFVDRQELLTFLVAQMEESQSCSVSPKPC